MKWEKLADRKVYFLRNSLLYSALEEKFQKIFGMKFCNFLTTIHGDTFSHYYDTDSMDKVSLFIRKQLEKNPDFISDSSKKGEAASQKLVDFSKKVSEIRLDKLSNPEIKELFNEYFKLYKEVYPYFVLTVLESQFIDNKNAVRLLAKWRLLGRGCFNQVHELIKTLFKEFGKRFNLSVEEVKSMGYTEILDILDGKKFDVKVIIKKRKNCYFLHINGKSELHEDEIFDIKEELPDEIKGRGTYKGFYKGPVCVIEFEGDLSKLKKGEIPVTRMTAPEMAVSAIKKAGAIITDEGGLTCHTAIISREFKIPTLIGTKVATKLLKDGDIVEVDTEKGIVKLAKHL